MLSDVSVGDTGSSISTYQSSEGKLIKLVFVVLPSKSSRHNSPFQPHAVASLLGGAVGSGSARVNFLLEEEWQIAPLACAVARAFPLYSSKQKTADASDEERVISVNFLSSGAQPTRVNDEARLRAATVAADGVRLTGKLVDMPPQEMDTEALVAEARRVSADLPGVRFEAIIGRELEAKGYGGIWGVGKAAEKPPALVLLSWEPQGYTETVCLVGKGIVYDTGQNGHPWYFA
jgi:probable aminopeptidase NPEPL1